MGKKSSSTYHLTVTTKNTPRLHIGILLIFQVKVFELLQHFTPQLTVQLDPDHMKIIARNKITESCFCDCKLTWLLGSSSLTEFVCQHVQGERHYLACMRRCLYGHFTSMIPNSPSSPNSTPSGDAPRNELSQLTKIPLW